MNINQQTLFDMTKIMPTLDELVELARATIWRLYESLTPVCVAFSGGKDSTVVADLALVTARDFVKQTGIQPLLIVTTSDTLAENPEVHQHYRTDLRLMREYGKRHGFRVITRIATPGILDTFQHKVLSGRGLPSFAGMNNDCSVSLKIVPQQKLRAEIFVELEAAKLREPVTLLGTRYDESEKRSISMMIRQENAITPVRNPDGDLILSPVCDFTTDDIFLYIGTRVPGDSYSDFKETLRLYSHSEGTSCAIVAAAIQEGMSKRKKGGCGARHGCYICQAATDKSLANMIAYDDRYSYAAGLNRLNRFIRNTRYDMSRRHWIGRTIKAGYIAIAPDTYHPNTVRELFRYMLQLQFDEQCRARMAGEAQKFHILTNKMVLAIDAYWSLNGLATPFSAWADVDAIYSGRKRYDIPEIEPFPVRDVPSARFIHVGGDWEDSLSSYQQMGMRDPYFESLLEGSACEPSLRTVKSSGRVIWDAGSKGSFDVYDESVEMILGFEMERLLEMHKSYSTNWMPGSITFGYKWYLTYGALKLGSAQVAKHDEILRRTAHKDSLGMTCNYDIDELLAKSIRFSDLPDDARKAWSQKATTHSAQSELCLED